jgi:hypothetical protein
MNVPRVRRPETQVTLRQYRIEFELCCYSVNLIYRLSLSMVYDSHNNYSHIELTLYESMNSRSRCNITKRTKDNICSSRLDCLL